LENFMANVALTYVVEITLESKIPEPEQALLTAQAELAEQTEAPWRMLSRLLSVAQATPGPVISVKLAEPEFVASTEAAPA
jgi:hypothetical protein